MRARLALIPVIAAAALLAGCKDTPGPGPTQSPTPPAPTDNGVAALPPKEILAKAVTAAASAKSFHMAGQMKIDADTLAIDLTISGKNGKGSITAQGHRVDLIKLGTDVYFKADEGFWNTFGGEQPAIGALLKDKWVKAPTGDSFAEFENFFDTSELIKSAGTLTKGETKSVNGTPAIGIVSDAADGGTIYVATQGEPYPLRIEGPAGSGAVDLTDWNATVEITAPQASEVIDLSQIK